MPPPTRPSRAAPMKRMQPRQAKKTISKKPSTAGRRNKSVKKKPASRRIAMPARSWLKMMGCAISGLEIAGMAALELRDERLFLVCDELREIIDIAEGHINN